MTMLVLSLAPKTDHFTVSKCPHNSFFSVQIGENQGPVEVVTAGQNMAAPPKSPMIFVVPNSGQKQQVSIRQLLERLSKS